MPAELTISILLLTVGFVFMLANRLWALHILFYFASLTAFVASALAAVWSLSLTSALMWLDVVLIMVSGVLLLGQLDHFDEAFRHHRARKLFKPPKPDTGDGFKPRG